MTATFSIRIAASAIAMVVGPTAVFAADNSPTATTNSNASKARRPACVFKNVRNCGISKPTWTRGVACFRHYTAR